MKFPIYSDSLFLECSKDGMYLADSFGYVLEKEQALFVAEEIKKYVKKYSKEIEQSNIERDKYYEDLRNGKIKEDAQKQKRSGYVYLMESGGKYKVGFSTDVTRRAKELNNRPFPVTVLAVSKRTKVAREEEKKLHEAFANHRIDGEWYELEDDTVLCLAKYIESINDGFYRTGMEG